MHTSLVVSVCGWLPLVLPALTGVDVRYSNLRCEVRNRARFVPLLTVLAAGQEQLEVMVEVCSFASARMQRRSWSDRRARSMGFVASLCSRVVAYPAPSPPLPSPPQNKRSTAPLAPLSSNVWLLYLSRCVRVFSGRGKCGNCSMLEFTLPSHFAHKLPAFSVRLLRATAGARINFELVRAGWRPSPGGPAISICRGGGLGLTEHSSRKKPGSRFHNLAMIMDRVVVSAISISNITSSGERSACWILLWRIVACRVSSPREDAVDRTACCQSRWKVGISNTAATHRPA